MCNVYDIIFHALLKSESHFVRLLDSYINIYLKASRSVALKFCMVKLKKKLPRIVWIRHKNFLPPVSDYAMRACVFFVVGLDAVLCLYGKSVI